MDKLKPCPFCGGKAHIMKMGYPHFVYCKDCGAKIHGGVIGEEEGEKASVEAWNKRADKDMAEIVRCKDCKYWTMPTIQEIHGNCRLYSICPKADWFCADGERKRTD